jgi:periplasmic protein TonB
MTLRRWTLAGSACVHGVALVVLLLWSIVHVDELPSPAVPVMFFGPSGAPPPPPPPPGKPSAHPVMSHRVVRVKAPTAPPVVIDDSDAAEDEPEGGGESGGVPGGQIGGVIGGVLGGILGGTGLPEPTPPEPPTIPSSQVQIVYGAIPPYLDEAKAAGITGVVTAKICVTPSGTVASVTIVKPLRLLDDSVKRTVSTWRYKPWIVGGQPRAFCNVAHFAFDLD